MCCHFILERQGARPLSRGGYPCTLTGYVPGYSYIMMENVRAHIKLIANRTGPMKFPHCQQDGQNEVSTAMEVANFPSDWKFLHRALQMLIITSSFIGHSYGSTPFPLAKATGLTQGYRQHCKACLDKDYSSSSWDIHRFGHRLTKFGGGSLHAGISVSPPGYGPILKLPLVSADSLWSQILVGGVLGTSSVEEFGSRWKAP